MIARLVVVAAGIVAAAAGAAAWAKRRTEQDDALEEEILGVVAEDGQAEESGSGGDELQTIKGIGGVSAGRLSNIGVTTYAQIAEWSPDDIDTISAQIKVSAERIKREDWVGQAQTLSNS